MTPREINLDTYRIGRRILLHDFIDSTNTRCAEYAGEEANDGLVIVAGAQTDGRGQHGRRWLAQPGTSVLMSVLLYPPRHACRPVLLTAWAAVSVCDYIEAETNLMPRIKWPNDVLVAGRKVCGILIEQKGAVVAGIGLNLNQEAESFAMDDLPDAGSLRLITGRHFDVEQQTLHMVRILDRNYRCLLDNDLSNLESRWNRQLGLMDQQIVVEGQGGNYHGCLTKATFTEVVLQTDGGERIALSPESIKHITHQKGSSTSTSAANSRVKN